MTTETKQMHPPLETIYCDACGNPVAQTNGRFLRPVMVLCVECKHKTKWYPPDKPVDKTPPKGR